jgi:serine phosphatase RsbU (regulator of sigma subunit)/catechol 2,3-dioxygenase-like lactoylglutathione lyase family enzyme
MGVPVLKHKARRCSFQPDRQDLYLRLGTISVFVRDLEGSLHFYVNHLGFDVSLDTRLPSGLRWLVVTPPDGTANIALVAPKPDSDEYKLIGRPVHLEFLTEDVFRKCEEWRKHGVRIVQEPERQSWGGVSAKFADLDGNTFSLASYDALNHEIAQHRREHVERFEAERRLAQDLENARQVQARLFPQTQPEVPTLEYSGLCMQARVVGGDYYDFLELGRNRFGLVIGDVSGKGTAAALLMANLQAHLRNLCASYSSRPFTPFAVEQPQRFLQSLNRLFFENTGNNSFATLFFTEYDAPSRRVRYANCGHLPALLLRGDNHPERLDATSTVIGAFKDWDCSASERQLSVGDTLLFYTDGVTESFNDAGEEFGEGRLVELLQRHRDFEAPALLHSIMDGVREFSAQDQQDDITLIVARCR